MVIHKLTSIKEETAHNAWRILHSITPIRPFYVLVETPATAKGCIGYIPLQILQVSRASVFKLTPCDILVAWHPLQVRETGKVISAIKFCSETSSHRILPHIWLFIWANIASRTSDGLLIAEILRKPIRNPGSLHRLSKPETGYILC